MFNYLKIHYLLIFLSDQSAIGDKIFSLKKGKGWSYRQMARKIGTGGRITGRYERGEMVPSVEVAKARKTYATQ